MKKTMIFCFAALICAAACTEKNVSVGNDGIKTGFPYTLTASISDMDRIDETKVELADPNPANPATATWTAEWKIGDEIWVFNQTGVDNAVAYVVTSINNGQASFALKDGEDISKFSDATVFFAAKGGFADDMTSSHLATHPYLYDFNTNGEGGINTGLTSYKRIMEGSIDNDFFLAVAKATLTDGNLNFKFIPVVSYIRITIPEGMTDVGQLYFQSTVASGTPNPSGFFRVRMNLAEDTIKEIGKRNRGGSANAPFFYGTGTSNIAAAPYPNFTAGSYYVPVIPGCTVKKLIVKDTQGATKRTCTFDSPAFTAGKIYDLGSIPAE